MRGAMALAMVALLLTGQYAAAQAPGDGDAREYRDLFPTPTGLNGCEDLALAGLLASRSALLKDAESATATLSQKRAYLEDPPVVRALALVKQGLAKPFRIPEVQPGAQGDAAFRVFALIRRVARLLNVAEYVQLADGRVSQAIDTLRDGLRIGYNLQSAAIIGSLVGVAVDSTVLRQFGGHLDQLSARDCDRLLVLARDWVAAPDPGIACLAAEKQAATAHLPEVPQRAAVATMYGLVLERLTADLRRPYWERFDLPSPPETSDTAAAALFSGLWETSRPVYATVMDRWTQELAEIQMLGVHAAVRRYRWEYGRLPAGISDLKLGPLGVDPFTGRPVGYRATDGGGYEIWCAGAQPRDDQGRVRAGDRTPVYFPRRATPP